MNFHDFTLRALNGEEIDFNQFRGKKVLLINVASECGFTPQYEDLQMLHEKHGEKVAVLGFPANDFGAQEPGSNQSIETFCNVNYGVTFQMFEKLSILGNERSPLYRWLEDESGKTPNWNFCKYLIDEEGKVIEFFQSAVNPLEEVITDKL